VGPLPKVGKRDVNEREDRETAEATIWAFGRRQILAAILVLRRIGNFTTSLRRPWHYA